MGNVQQAPKELNTDRMKRMLKVLIAYAKDIRKGGTGLDSGADECLVFSAHSIEALLHINSCQQAEINDLKIQVADRGNSYEKLVERRCPYYREGESGEWNCCAPADEHVAELENRYSELLHANSRLAAIETELKERGIHLLSKDCWCEPAVEVANESTV